MRSFRSTIQCTASGFLFRTALALIVLGLEWCCAQSAPSRPLKSQTPLSLPQWVRRHVGVVLPFPKAEEGDTGTLDEITTIAREFLPPGVVAWAEGKRPGDLLPVLQSPAYRRILDSFRCVKLNLCQTYMSLDYDYHARPMQQVFGDVERDWYEVTRLLARKYRGSKKVFLLCYGQELNVYFGREGVRPDFPLADYIAAGHRGKEKALAEAGDVGGLEIYDVAEVQFFLDFDRWVNRFVPHLHADLFGLTYYPNGRSLTDQLNYLADHAPHHPRFGDRNIVLSEVGETLEQVYWDERKQLGFMKDTLQEARNWGVLYAFWFQLTDTSFVVRTAGYCGLQGPRESPVRRLAGDYLFALWHGVEEPSLPDRSPQRTMATIPQFAQGLHREGKLPDLEVSDVRWTPAVPRAGERVYFTVTVKNTGDAPTATWDEKNGKGAVIIGVEVDGHYVGYGMWTAPIKPGEAVDVEILRWSPRAFWRATPGGHQVCANVNASGEVVERDLTPAGNVLCRGLTV